MRLKIEEEQLRWSERIHNVKKITRQQEFEKKQLLSEIQE